LDVAIFDHQQSLEISDHMTVVTESPTLPLMVVDPQSNIVISSATLPAVVDAPVTIIESSTSLAVALQL
jgi:hypothetical protein